MWARQVVPLPLLGEKTKQNKTELNSDRLRPRSSRLSAGRRRCLSGAGSRPRQRPAGRPRHPGGSVTCLTSRLLRNASLLPTARRRPPELAPSRSSPGAAAPPGPVAPSRPQPAAASRRPCRAPSGTAGGRGAVRQGRGHACGTAERRDGGTAPARLRPRPGGARRVRERGCVQRDGVASGLCVTGALRGACGAYARRRAPRTGRGQSPQRPTRGSVREPRLSGGPRPAPPPLRSRPPPSPWRRLLLSLIHI